MNIAVSIIVVVVMFALGFLLRHFMALYEKIEDLRDRLFNLQKSIMIDNAIRNNKEQQS